METKEEFKIMVKICKSLSEVCKRFKKQEEKKLKRAKNNLKLSKKHKIKGVAKIRSSIKVYEKLVDDFDRKSKVFKDFARFYKIKLLKD